MEQISKSGLSTEIMQEFNAVTRQVMPKAPISLLCISEGQTIIISGISEADSAFISQIGTQSLPQRFFQSFPPTPAETENAIIEVEEEVMPIRKGLPIHSELYTRNSIIRDMAKLTVSEITEDKVVILRENIEHLFNRLSAIITGRPASQDILPANNEFVSALLILREVMHHLGFEKITILK